MKRQFSADLNAEALRSHIVEQAQIADFHLGHGQVSTTSQQESLNVKLTQLQGWGGEIGGLFERLTTGLSALFSLSKHLREAKSALARTESSLSHPLTSLTAPFWLESQAQNWDVQVCAQLEEIARLIETQIQQDSAAWRGKAAQAYASAVKQEPGDLRELSRLGKELAAALEHAAQAGIDFYQSVLALLLAIASLCVQIALLCSNPITIWGVLGVIATGLMPAIAQLDATISGFTTLLSTQEQELASLSAELELFSSLNGNTWKPLVR